MMTMRRLATAAQALAASALLLIALPIGLLAASEWRFGTGNPLAGLRPPWTWGREELDASIRRPLEDDTVVDLILRCCIVIAWVALAVVVLTVVLEVVHLLRHRGLPSPTRPGLGWAQPVARFIAAGIVGVLPLSTATAAEPIATLTSPEPAVRSLSTPAVGASLDDETPAFPVPQQRNDRTLPEPRRPATPQPDDRRSTERLHLVARGESVWSIAESHTDGDDGDTVEMAERILDRNLGRTMNDGATFDTAALIRPGWELILPLTNDEPAQHDLGPSTAGGGERPLGSGERLHEVQDGDTLTDIAADALGDPAAWPEIAELNLGRTMGDGRVFDDPDLILPGWELVIDTGNVAPDSPTPTVDTAPANPKAPPDPTEDPAVPQDPPLPPEAQIDWFDEEPVSESGLELAPPTEPAVSTAPPPVLPTSTTTTVPPVSIDRTDGAADPRDDAAPSPLGLEHAGMLAGGLLLLAGIRRRRRLRSARARERLPEPTNSVTGVERSLRSVGTAEARARLDVAIRSMASVIVGTGRQPVVIEHRTGGEIVVVLTGPVHLPSPWAGAGSVWTLPASIPIELLTETARSMGDPCPALVAVGRTASGELLVDPEAAGVMTVDAPAEVADTVVTSLASTLATSLAAETAHLVTVGLEPAAVFDHPNAIDAGDPTEALVIATRLVGRTSTGDTGTFDLRARRTGGEPWEPAVVLVSAVAAAAMPWSAVPDPGHGVATIVAASSPDPVAGVRLRSKGTEWTIETTGWSTTCRPFGLDADTLERIDEFMTHADAHPTPVDVDDRIEAEPSTSETAENATDVEHVEGRSELAHVEPAHAIVVNVLGGVTITDVAGHEHAWQRSKTVELIAWLATHRSRSTRSAARAAMWVEEIRDATFSNIVSEARRGLARLVPPPDDVEWIPRTSTDELLLHDQVVTDLDLITDRLDAARLAPPGEAMELLQPAVERIDGAPFAGTTYLWPDADGLVTDATLLAIAACVELAQHALSVGELDAVFAATGRALAVLPGHEESIALRMRAHARRGDLAGVRREWEGYERIITADAWSDGEPAEELVQLRHDLLNS